LAERTAELRRGLRARSDGALVAPAFGLIRETARRTLGMEPFETQIMGGWIMWRGMLAEMETGEGKTLTATLPACVAALAGVPVHVVTVNDYLVERDAELMGPLYRRLGLRVGTVTEQNSNPSARREAYACDVVYVSNKQVAFDYLRDRVALAAGAASTGGRPSRLGQSDLDRAGLVMRGLCFAIVDEADSVLIDEARTPLILSRTEGGADEEAVFHEALEIASALVPGRDFVVDRRDRNVQWTSEGCERARQLACPRGGVWTAERRRLELLRQAASARLLFKRDEDYLVRDDRVEIIDPNTGRGMPDRAWEAGLHQMIEAKEGCPISGRRATLARITTQRFYSRYLRLAGMTGTAHEVSRELRSVYGLRSIRVPTRRPGARHDLGERFYATADERWHSVVERVRELHTRGRPVLVGTRSVASSEILSGLLAERGLPHELLNARQDRDEAEIIARAGECGRLTVATNMAGRGADVRLGPGAEALGGLHVIAVERSEARRIDRQLFGRCGRQGDPGSVELVSSLDDDIVMRWIPERLRVGIQRAAQRGVPLAAPVGRWVAACAQRAAEWRHARGRQELMRREEALERMLGFSGIAE
jgi:preprotein translocase subunit SecA